MEIRWGQGKPEERLWSELSEVCKSAFAEAAKEWRGWRSWEVRVTTCDMQVPWRRVIASAAVVMGIAMARGGEGDAAAVAAGTVEKEEVQWLDALRERVVQDVTAGRPLVVQVHAPLCDASIIPCGNARLGDGDNLDTNLYWATTAGFGRWFARRGGGWKKVKEWRDEATGDEDVLSLSVYRRTMPTPKAWQRRGAPKSFAMYVVIHGWRGTAIDRALAAYARALAGQDARALEVNEESEETVMIGGAAHLVAYSGHNRLMDVPAYEWPAAPAHPIGVIAVACMTASYMEDEVSAPTRVPLLMTRDFLFANAAPVEAVALSFARGEGYREMRLAGAAAYAGVQKREVKRVFGAFTNPADGKWGKRR